MWPRKVSLKRHPSKDLKEMQEVARAVLGAGHTRRGTAIAKSARQVHTQHVLGTAKKPACPEQMSKEETCNM